MFVASENEYTEASIKEELERLYLAAGYINAERDNNLEIAMHLIGAAIAELESLAEQNETPAIWVVHSRDEMTE